MASHCLLEIMFGSFRKAPHIAPGVWGFLSKDATAGLLRHR